MSRFSSAKRRCCSRSFSKVGSAEAQPDGHPVRVGRGRRRSPRCDLATRRRRSARWRRRPRRLVGRSAEQPPQEAHARLEELSVRRAVGSPSRGRGSSPGPYVGRRRPAVAVRARRRRRPAAQDRQRRRAGPRWHRRRRAPTSRATGGGAAPRCRAHGSRAKPAGSIHMASPWSRAWTPPWPGSGALGAAVGAAGALVRPGSRAGSS